MSIAHNSEVCLTEEADARRAIRCSIVYKFITKMPMVNNMHTWLKLLKINSIKCNQTVTELNNYEN